MSARPFKYFIVPITVSGSASAGKSNRNERIPTSAHARILLRTYTRDAGSDPTRMTARPGTTPRLASCATRALHSVRMLEAIFVPSMTFPTTDSVTAIGRSHVTLTRVLSVPYRQVVPSVLPNEG